MNRDAALFAFAIAAGASICSGCGKKDISEITSSDGGAIRASATLGSSGGTLAFPQGPVLTVPAGALSAETTLAIEQLPRGVPGGGPVYQFGPDGTVFSAPVAVTFPASGSGTTIYWSRLGSQAQFDALPTTATSDGLTAQVSHFSLGYVGAAPRTVQGAFKTIYVTDDGAKTSRAEPPPDGSKAVALLIPNGGAQGYDALPITLKSDGTFTASGVPGGPYFLRLDSVIPMMPGLTKVPTTSVVLSQLSTDQPDLAAVVAARPDCAKATKSTPIKLNVSGMDPWDKGGDLLVMATSQANAFVRPVSSSSVTAGATEHEFDFDWFTDYLTIGGAPLPDASKGDVTWFYQRHRTTLGSGATAGLKRVGTRFAKSTTFKVTDGVGAAEALSLIAAPLSHTVATAAQLSKFAALAAAQPAARHAEASTALSLYATPQTIAFPDMPHAATSLLYISFGDPTLDTDYGPQAYGGFLEGAWQEWRQFTYSVPVTVTPPGAAAGQDVDLFYVVQQSMSSPDSAAAIAPVIGPVAGLAIDGKDATHPLADVGLTPALSWSPPVLGTPSLYSVHIHLLGEPVANELTDVWVGLSGATSFRVPPGLLSANRSYVAIVTAEQAPWDASDRPFRTGVSYSAADAATDAFSTGSSVATGSSAGDLIPADNAVPGWTKISRPGETGNASGVARNYVQLIQLIDGSAAPFQGRFVEAAIQQYQSGSLSLWLRVFQTSDAAAAARLYSDVLASSFYMPLTWSPASVGDEARVSAGVESQTRINARKGAYYFEVMLASTQLVALTNAERDQAVAFARAVASAMP